MILFFFKFLKVNFIWCFFLSNFFSLVCVLYFVLFIFGMLVFFLIRLIKLVVFERFVFFLIIVLVFESRILV